MPLPPPGALAAAAAAAPRPPGSATSGFADSRRNVTPMVRRPAVTGCRIFQLPRRRRRPARPSRGSRTRHPPGSSSAATKPPRESKGRSSLTRSLRCGPPPPGPSRRPERSSTEGLILVFADGQAAHQPRDRHVPFQQRRRHRKHVADIVEAVARIVHRQRRPGLDIERQHVANRVAVLRAIQAMHGGPAGIGIARLPPGPATPPAIS